MKKVILICVIAACACLIIILAVRNANETRMRTISPDEIQRIEELDNFTSE